jgi:hypothetical protein
MGKAIFSVSTHHIGQLRILVYHTPGGNRILLGAERTFFTHTLAMIIDLLADDDAEFGIAAFDQLQRNQKLYALYKAARGLLHPDEPIPKLSAYVESSVAVVYEQAKERVFQEIDDPDVSGETSFWRRLVRDAAREQVAPDELPHETDRDKEVWLVLIECLAGCVLWDNDYESQESLDLPPEKSKHLRTMLGMADDYYTDVPPDPPDEQINLYVDALKGLTVEAR